MRIIDVFLKNRLEFNKRFLAEAPHGGLITDVVEPVQEGELVNLVVRFEGRQEEYSILGAVLWIRRGQQMLKSIGIGFLATEADKREFLLARAPEVGQLCNEVKKRKEPRYPLVMRIGYRTGHEDVIERTRDVSRGGCAVESQRSPRIGSWLPFQLYFPGQEEVFEVVGEVVWQNSQQGFGVKFAEMDEQTRVQIEQIIHRLAADNNNSDSSSSI